MSSARSCTPALPGRLGHRRGEPLDVLLGRVPGAHPSDLARRLVPHIEVVALAQCRDRVTVEEREYGVGLNRPRDGYPWEIAHTLGEQRGHRVGLAGVAQPQLVSQQRVELGREEAHL